MSQILKVVNMALDNIDNKGHDFRNTRESVGLEITLSVHSMNMSEEEQAVQNYFGDRYEKRFNDEYFHYEQLRYSLLHKLQEIQFFFKEGIENRKTIISSNDCISSIQYIKRGTYTALYVHMRSSDVKDLLPLDLLYLCKILKNINYEFCKGEDIQVAEVLVFIGSAHYYVTGGRE